MLRSKMATLKATRRSSAISGIVTLPAHRSYTPKLLLLWIAMINHCLSSKVKFALCNSSILKEPSKIFCEAVTPTDSAKGGHLTRGSLPTLVSSANILGATKWEADHDCVLPIIAYTPQKNPPLKSLPGNFGNLSWGADTCRCFSCKKASCERFILGG